MCFNFDILHFSWPLPLNSKMSMRGMKWYTYKPSMGYEMVYIYTNLP